MEFINKEYLSLFEAKEVNSEIPLQPKKDEKHTIYGKYPIAKDGDEKNKTYISLNYLLDEVKDKEFDISFNILSTILSGLDSSPLKRALIESELGQDIYGGHFSK